MSSPPRRAAQPSAAGRDDGVGGGRDRDADMSTSPKPHSSSKLVRSPSNSSASRRAHFPKQVRPWICLLGFGVRDVLESFIVWGFGGCILRWTVLGLAVLLGLWVIRV